MATRVAIALALCLLVSACASSPQSASIREIDAGIYSAHAETLWTPEYAWPGANAAAQRKCDDAQMITLDRKEERVIGSGSSVDLVFRCLAYTDNSPDAVALRTRADNDATRESARQTAIEQQRSMMLMQTQNAMQQQQAIQAAQQPQMPRTTNCTGYGNTVRCNSY